MKEINVNEIDKIEKPFVIDVREKEEIIETGTIKDAIHIPMMKIPNNLDKIPKDREVYILCRSGQRSFQVSNYLDELGYEAINLEGGILDYKGKLEENGLWKFNKYFNPSDKF